MDSNNNQTLKIISVVALVAIVLLVAYFNFFKTSEVVENTNTQATTTTQTIGTEYHNTKYNFTFALPESWKGYTVVESTWKGDSVDAQGQSHLSTVTGPLISIRHPQWTTANPRQDIPVMVFTISQWNDMQADKFHIGAAPINPSELGRNSNYVFAIPARYNFSYLIGYEEVDQIIRGTNFSAK